MRITDNPENLRVVQEGMQMTIHGPGGTARAMSVGAPYRMAGKTGTAQVVNRRAQAVIPKSLPLHQRHRALFVGYAPAENPSIAVAVMVEGGGYGGSTAAPIARKIFDAHLLGKMPEGMKSENEEALSAPVVVGREIQINEPAAAPTSGTQSGASPAASTPAAPAQVPRP